MVLDGPTTSPSNPFGDDDDPFGLGPSASAFSSVSGVKELPPLTAQQIAQHRSWLFGAIANSGGPLFDDGVIQIATKLEIRGSQARFTLFVRNKSASSVDELSVSLQDPSGLLRFEAGTMPSHLDASTGQAQQIIMMECMKPAAPGPTFTVGYTDAVQGTRKMTVAQALPLPIFVTSFNEPLALSAPDFSARWAQLTAPGLEAVEVVSLPPSSVLSPAVIGGALTSILKFGTVSGMPDGSDLVLYGSAVLRTGALAANKAGAMEKISVGCMIKLELNTQANAIRVTVRTLHPAATAAILLTAKTLLI